jgi:uncharacterized membrane-anchored protein YitT (DUF2179 family)
MLLIIAGTALMAAGIILFIKPNKMAIGGVPGMAVPLHFITGFPTGILIFFLNLPIFLVGVKKLGRLFGIQSIFAIISFSLFTDLFGEVLNIPNLTNEYILATLYGGTLTGIGIGLVFRAGASTGGTAVLAKVLAARLQVKLGVVLMAFDFVIILFGGIYFKNIELILWGILFTYIMSQVADYVLAGPPMGKVAYVISETHEKINKEIINTLKRGGTLFAGQGIYTMKERKMLMVVLDNSEVIPFKEIVQKIDPRAFVIISNTYEILGEGFSGK